VTTGEGRGQDGRRKLENGLKGKEKRRREDRVGFLSWQKVFLPGQL